jgi:hypothetical protein
MAKKVKPPTITERLDNYGRQHPTWMLVLVILTTIFLTVPALLYNSQGAAVLYQAF